ncbi:hypothetical protein RW64_20375 [Geobacter sulfurreducens]|nr:hypothetical protein RW64_20375 [Geobacter sulfurreducens]
MRIACINDIDFIEDAVVSTENAGKRIGLFYPASEIIIKDFRERYERNAPMLSLRGERKRKASISERRTEVVALCLETGAYFAKIVKGYNEGERAKGHFIITIEEASEASAKRSRLERNYCLRYHAGIDHMTDSRMVARSTFFSLSPEIENQRIQGSSSTTSTINSITQKV